MAGGSNRQDWGGGRERPRSREALGGICTRQTVEMPLALSHDACDCGVEKVGRGKREAGQEDVAIVKQDVLEAWPRWCLWKLVQELSVVRWILMASDDKRIMKGRVMPVNLTED